MVFIFNAEERKERILIVDDAQMNRAILADMLEADYEIIEAENGVEAVSILQKRSAEISLVLLDMVMPEMDGFEVLDVMEQEHWMDSIPVIMISAESDVIQMQRAYDKGVVDFILRPFDERIVRRRVVNTILLYTNQKQLIELVAEVIWEKESVSNLLIEILSHVVEFRNEESGQHILRIHVLTELFLKHLAGKTQRYHLSPADISLIVMASALHDIGKIAVDERILNKPARLTDEEFEIIKTHTLLGAKMLDNLPIYTDEPLLKVAYQICRWHHERYDGRGYPDGLAGDDIPIAAQVVALADVYDALTSERCYKKAYSHETAVNMILEGQCGSFNPLLMECLREMGGGLEAAIQKNELAKNNQHELWKVMQEALRDKDVNISDRSLQQLNHERMKANFYADMSGEIQFEYTLAPEMLTLSDWGARKLGLKKIIADPKHDQAIRQIGGADKLDTISKTIRSTTPEAPVVRYECELHHDGQSRWYQIVARSLWEEGARPRYVGAIGKAVDIHESLMRLMELEKQASYDMMTDLLNRYYAERYIKERLAKNQNAEFVLALLDLDEFKRANDTNGHLFGDRMLQHVAQLLRQAVRSSDIIARAGGDEFLIFLKYTEDADLDAIISRIFNMLTGSYHGFKISISMGAAQTATVGYDYDRLFQAADQALYSAKKAGKGRYCYYDATMRNTLSAISPIDGQDNKAPDVRGGGVQ